MRVDVVRVETGQRWILLLIRLLPNPITDNYFYPNFILFL